MYVNVLKKVESGISDYQYAKKSGFWDEENIFEFSKKKSRTRMLKFTEEDEFQAIEEIMEALETKKIDSRYVNSETSMAQFIDLWAREIRRDRLKKKSLIINHNPDKDPLDSKLNDNIRKNKCKEAKIPKMIKKIKGVLDHCEEPFQSRLTTIIEDLQSYLAIILKKESQTLGFEEESSEPSSQDNEYFKKYDFGSCYDIDRNEMEIFSFTNITILNSKGKRVKIPDWEIQDIYEKFYNRKEELISETNIEESTMGQEGEKGNIKEKIKEKERKEARQFDNLEAELAMQQAKKQLKEKINKTDRITRIKMKQK